MIKRDIEKELITLSRQYFIVVVSGPRQSGKTTLVRNIHTDKLYINLEEPDIREAIVADPRRFFSQIPEQGVILDEIQRAPELLSYIQAIVDKDKIPGKFILTGSHQLQLHQAITQSLAGRVGILELLPLSINELKCVGIEQSDDEYLYKGFYPAIYDRHLDPTVCYRNYLRTYVERDVRQIINVKDLNSFRRFLQILAGRVGNLLNAENICNEVGVAHNTIKNWLSILEASYIAFRLHPYFENFGKRLIKSPKIYFNDVGMATYLLGIENTIQVARDPLRGALFENMVLLDLIKQRFNNGKDSNLFFFRDSHGNEVDIIIKYQNYLIPVEVKSAVTYNNDLLKSIFAFKKIAGERAPYGFLVYAGEIEYQIQDCFVINYKNLDQIFSKLEGLLL